MTFFASVIALFGQDIIVTGFGFFNSILLARWLGPTQLGLFYIVSLIPIYSEKFGRLGMVDHASIYFLGRKKYEVGEMTGHLTWIAVLFSLLPIALFAVFHQAFTDHFVKVSTVPLYYLWCAVASIPFIFLMVSYNKILLSQNMVRDFSVVQILRAVLFILFCIFFWLRGWNFFGVILAGLVTTCLVALYNLWLIKKKFVLSFTPNGALLKDLFGYGWKIYFVTIVTFLHQRFDLVLIALYLPSAEVSFYSLAAGIAQLLWKIPNAVSNLLFPEVSKKSSVDAAHFTTLAIRHSFLILILATLVMAAVAVPCVTLFFGSRYAPLIKPLLLLLPGVVAMGIAKLLTEHFYGQGHPRAVFKATALATPINILLNIIFVPRYGINLVFLLMDFKTIWGVSGKELFHITREDWILYRSLLSQLRQKLESRKKCIG